MLAHIYLQAHLFITFNVCGGRSENNLQESALDLHHVGPTAQTLGCKLGGNHLYPLSHLASLVLAVFNNSLRN